MEHIAWWKDPQWYAIAVALFLGISGIFQDWLRALFKRPKLRVSISLEPPDCLKVPVTLRGEKGRNLHNAYNVYYLSFRVENQGNYRMEDAEVMVVSLRKRGLDHRYKRVRDFVPLNLTWAHSRDTTMPKIQPHLHKHCAFGEVAECIQVPVGDYGISEAWNVVFVLNTAVEPSTGSHILEPGDYQIKLVFAANNLKPKTKTYNLTIQDRWSENENEMFEKIVSVREI